MGTKTYTSASMSNLNTSGKEFRYGRLAMLEGAMSNWSHTMYGEHLQYTQRGGQGVGFRNWIYWARNYKYSGYRDEELKYVQNPERTYNEMINFYEPQVSAVVELSEEQMNGFIENTLQLPSGVEEIEDGSITVMGQLPDGTFQEVTITGRAKIEHKSKVIDSYSGAYDPEKLGEAYVWQEYEQYLKESEFIKRYILSDGENVGYKVIPGDNLAQAGEGDDDEPVNIEGSWEDCWLQLGYEFEEPHTNEETNEEVVEIIFNSEKDIYIPVKSSIPLYEYYFAIWGYTYDIVELDAKQFDITPEGYLKLNSAGEATKKPDPIIPDPPEGEEPEEPEREWTQIKTKFEIEFEDWEKTVKEEYESPINLASVKGFGYIDSLQNASNNPDIGSSIDADIQNIESYMVPMVCFRHDKSWLGQDWKEWWYINSKACKKLNQDKDYYSDLFDELKEQVTQGDVAWVYLIYGIPCNYTQTHQGAHYALQFFKQLTIPNWSQYKHGDVADVQGKGRSFKYGSRTFNCHFYFSLGNTHYRCGKGMCPAPGWGDIRPGEAGVVDYGGVTFWVQHQTDSWEMITISGYYTEFSAIKNGVSSSPGGADWFLPIWKEVDVERQYSKCIIPLMWTVGKNIPFTDWTDLMQFAPNVGATAYKVVKTKWYQSGLFQIILIIVIIIVIIVVSIFSCGTATGPAATAGSAIAGAIGGSAAFWTAVVKVCISVAVAVAVNAIITPLLQDIFGEVVGAVLGAVVSAIAGSYASTGTISSTSVLTELCSPQTWVNMANAAINAMKEMVMDQMKQLQRSYNAFREAAEARHQEILEANAELGAKDPWALQKVYGAATGNACDNCEIVGDPDQFFKRTVENPLDAANLAFAIVENFAQTDVDNHTIPAIAFGGSSSDSSLGQTV